MKILKDWKTVSVSSFINGDILFSRRFRSIPYESIKNDILGSDYELSIVLIGRKRSKSLNSKFRGKNADTDVLAFQISEKMGEIFINPRYADMKWRYYCNKSDDFKKKFPKFENYLLFIVIHALFHLKGLVHGDKMEKYEFAHYSRYRRRYL